EYLQKQKHNTLAYSRIPKNHIVIFDIEDINGNPFLPESKRKMVENIGFETPQLFDVEIKTADDILNLMNAESMLGGTTIEGVVIKNYGKLVPDGKYMVGKYVSEKFKEKHVKEWRGNNPSAKDIISLIGEELKTEARYI
ncbi:hypothetical protein RZS08_11640, partial [Arthrospira platensis SPKY1]|nr:hypothetical protein [Arthrospira platensis SPKY1]